MVKYVWRVESSQAVEMDKEWVILDPAQFTVTRLNESAGLCWTLLKEPATAEALVAEIMKEYEIAEADARIDVNSFLARMMEINLIRHAS